MKHRVWVDLTDMLIWRGHLTGIQRVVFEYAIRFTRQDSMFFAYDRIDKRFFEVDAGILDLTQSNNDVSTEDPLPSMTTRLRLRRILGAPYYALSEEKRKKLQPTVQYANYLARGTMSHLLPTPEPAKEISQYVDRPSAEFAKGDTVVLLGAGWNEPGLFEAITEVKNSVGVCIVQHINDILPIYQPQLFSDELVESFTPYAQKVIRQADIITVISNATKRDLEIFCKEQVVTVPKICTIRLGDDVKPTHTRRPTAVAKDEPFMLSVGTFEIRKNYLLLYQALKLAQLEGRTLPKIVIAGRQGWLTQDIAHVIQKDPFASQRIIWLQDVSDEELSWLYANCLFTIFPSLSEGWGLPVAESLGHGKLCLASGVSSMLEIGDDLVDYFLPYDARECLDKIQQHLAGGRYVKENQKIKDNYIPVSWDDSYAQLVKAIQP